MNTSLLPGIRSGVLVLSLLGLAAAPVQAQKDFKRSLPESTIFLASAPDLPTAIEQFKKTELYKIWGEEEVQDFLADALDMAKKQFHQLVAQGKAMYKQGSFPIDPDKLLTVRLHGASFALVDLAPPSQKSMPKVSLALCLDFGPSAGVIKGILGMGEGIYAAKAQNSPEMMGPIQEAKVGEIAYKSIIPPQVPFLSLNWGWVGSSLLIGTDKADFEGIASRMSAGEQGGLLASGLYKAVSQKTHALEASIEVFCNFSRVLDLSLKGFQMAAMQEPDLAAVDFEGVKRALDATGISSLKAFGLATGYEGKVGITRAFGLVPEGERKGFFAATGSKELVNMDRLKIIPKDASSFSLASLDGMKNIYRAVLAGIDAYNPKVGEMVKGRIQGFEQNLGFSIEKDLFRAFGPEVISYSMPLAGLGGAPEMGLLIACPNPKKTVEVLRKIGKLTGGSFDLVENETENGVFYALDIQLDTGGGMDPMAMIEPTLAFEKGFMIFSLSRADVQEARNRLAGNPKTSILDNPVFKALQGTIPEGVKTLTFNDTAANFSGIYGALSGVISFISIPPEVPIDLGLLPSETAFTKHLSGTLSFTRLDPKGYLYVSKGPFSGPMTYAALGVGAIGIITALGVRSNRMKARRFGK